MSKRNCKKEACDVLVVGAGPAGMAAGTAAAAAGKSVIVLDDNPESGGQIWRREQNEAIERFAAANMQRWQGWQVVDALARNQLLVTHDGDLAQVGYKALVLATGARERFLPFPGWTLPNVMGAGGLQAFAKGGLPLEGKRVVVAGSGPLLLAVAAYLKSKGAIIAALCEQTDAGHLFRFLLSLVGQPDKLFQGVGLAWQLFPVFLQTAVWPVKAEGTQVVERVTLTDGVKQWQVECDYLACGFHLVPNTELAQLLGCQTSNGHVVHNALMRTSVANVFCAGEVAGVGGVDLAEQEGGTAGQQAALYCDAEPSSEDFVPAEPSPFRAALAECFALRPELKSMATDETIVCRCEDLRLGQIRPTESWREAKLHHRCGMGPCQGRVCGPAVEFLLGFPPASVRPPLFPVPISTWIKEPEITE